MNYVKYSHCTALKYRGSRSTGSTLKPEDFLFVRKLNETEENLKEKSSRREAKENDQVLGEKDA